MDGEVGQDDGRTMEAGHEIVEPDHHPDCPELLNGQGTAKNGERDDIGQARHPLIEDRVEAGHGQLPDTALDGRKDAAREWLPHRRAGRKIHMERRLRH